MKRIYLAQPYTSHYPLPEMREVVMQARYEDGVAATAWLMTQGYVPFSPIAHSRSIALIHDLPHGWDFWRHQDLNHIAACDEVLVLAIPGWRESAGVTAEIQFAHDCEIPVRYLNITQQGYLISTKPFN